ncbi:MAG TPA: tail fiber domain-containing protein, partial [Rudaea sp.]
QPLLLQSTAGVAINGTPKNSNTELSIYSPNYPNIFLGTTGKAGGILISQDYASSPTANDAALAIDEYDGGSGQSRKFYLNSAGVTVYGNEAVVGTATINGAAKDSGTELSIYPTSGLDYSNLFLGTSGAGGVQVSVGGQTSGTANNAGFFIDQYDGTHRARRFEIAGNGAVGINSVPDTGVALSIMKPGGADGSPPDGVSPLIVQLEDWELIEPLSGSSAGRLEFQYVGMSAPALSIINQDSIQVAASVYAGGEIHAGDDIYGAGNIIIGGDAYKPGGGSWSNSSDRRIKQDIAPIENALDTILKLKPVSFRYTPEYRATAGALADKEYRGFIAQDFREVFPEAVTSTGQRVPGASKDADPILALDSSPALITAVAAVQELAVAEQDDASRMRKLESENAELRAQLQRSHRTLEDVLARLAALEHGKGN